MREFFIFIGLWLTPVLLCRISCFYRGTVTGAFIALLLLSGGQPLLCAVPLLAALSLRRRITPKEEPQEVRVKSPSLPFFIVFTLSLSACYFFFPAAASPDSMPEVFSGAGHILYASPLALSLAPVVFGLWCDLRGPFLPALFLSLSYIVSLWLFLNEPLYSELYPFSRFLFVFGFSGSFTALPLLLQTCLGEKNFVPASLFLFFADLLFFFGLLRLFPLFFSGGTSLPLLLLLILADGVAVLSLYSGWKRRFSLAGKEPKAARLLHGRR